MHRSRARGIARALGVELDVSSWPERVDAHARDGELVVRARVLTDAQWMDIVVRLLDSPLWGVPPLRWHMLSFDYAPVTGTRVTLVLRKSETDPASTLLTRLEMFGSTHMNDFTLEVLDES